VTAFSNHIGPRIGLLVIATATSVGGAFAFALDVLAGTWAIVVAIAVLVASLCLGIAAIVDDLKLANLRRDHDALRGDHASLADAHYYATPEGEAAKIIAAKSGTPLPPRAGAKRPR
jgi:hypothetical protein